jgi:hypothetical protein
VERDEPAGLGRRDEGEAVRAPAGLTRGEGAEQQGDAVPHERPREHLQLVAGDRGDDRRCRAALVEDVERLVDDAGPEQPEPGIDGEDVEAVVRHRPGRDDRVHMLFGPADPAAEALLDVSCEVVRPHAVEQVVAHPIRLHDPSVEGVVDPVRAGDQREVRPGAVERASQLRQTTVRRSRVAVLEQRARVVRAAETERVRRVRVPRENQRPGRIGHVVTS